MIKVDLSIVRGLSILHRFLFTRRLKQANKAEHWPGGRYDHLIKKLSGNCDIPAAGFAIGDMTLTDCLKTNNLLPNYIIAPDLFIVLERMKDPSL